MAHIVKRERTGGEPSWRVRWRFGGGRSGEWQSVTVRTHERAKTVRALLAAHGDGLHSTDPRIHEVVTGLAVSPRTTFGEVARQYLDTRTTLGAGSRDTYATTLRTQLGHWTDRPVASFRSTDVAELVNSLQARGLSPVPAYKLAKAIFRYAADHEPPLRQGNPAASVPVKRRRRAVVPAFLSRAESEVLLSACDEAIRPMIAVTMRTGLRFGEVCALRVRDCTLTGPRPGLTVAQAVRRPEGGNGQRIGAPKSASSARSIRLDGVAVAALAAAMAGKGPDELIFPDPRTGQAWTHSAFTKRHWYPARARAAAAGLTSAPRFHDLRHTHAAWLLSAGVPLLVVSRRLGHDSVAITADTYGHLDPSTDDLVLAALA